MPSPAERYAAAAARSRRDRSQLGRFTAGLDFPLDDFQLRACEAVERGRGVLVAVGNGPAYGGGMRVTPDAAFDDGLLDVLVLNRISTPEFLRVFPKVFKGAHVTHPAVDVHRARSVRLEATGIVSYADGERFVPLPMTMEVVPGALGILA